MTMVRVRLTGDGANLSLAYPVIVNAKKWSCTGVCREYMVSDEALEKLRESGVEFEEVKQG